MVLLSSGGLAYLSFACFFFSMLAFLTNHMTEVLNDRNRMRNEISEDLVLAEAKVASTSEGHDVEELVL